MFWTELMEKLGTRFVQKFVPGGPPKVILVGDKDTYGDLTDAGVIKFKSPVTAAALKEVPFYFSEFDQTGKKINMPPLDAVVGQARAKQLLDNIQAHKEWINKNDAKITFVPTLGANSSDPDKRLVTINAIDPAIIHHELGHLNSPFSPRWFRYLRNRADFLGPAVSALALATKKMTGSNSPLLTAAQYGGAVTPLLGTAALIAEEKNATGNAMDFIKSNYPQDEVDASQSRLDAALGTYQHRWKRSIGSAMATLAATIMANKKLI